MIKELARQVWDFKISKYLHGFLEGVQDFRVVGDPVVYALYGCFHVEHKLRTCTSLPALVPLHCKLT